MPPKVPKKVPTWMGPFAEFAKSKERKRETQQAIDVFTQIVEKHWEAFAEKAIEAQAERPAKKRNVDPIKTMGRAMQNVAERVEEAKDNQELLKQYKERMRGVVPEQIKSVLSDVVGGGGGSDANKTSTEEWSRLLQQTADNLDALSQTTQKVMGYANVEQRDADMATQTLNQVSQGLEDLKESLNA